MTSDPNPPAIDAEPAKTGPRRRSRRRRGDAGRREAARQARARRRGALVLLILVLVFGGLIAGTVNIFFRSASSINRMPDPFIALNASQRPAKLAADGDRRPLTALLIGSDSRSEVQTTGSEGFGKPGSQRSDVIMLIQVSPKRDRAFVISIPRDAWVPIPGHGYNKINAAFAFGGPTLLVQTVENLTGIPIDHVGIVDFIAFKRITDTFGGVDVDVAENTRGFGVDFQQGLNHLDGEQALAFVRQRHGLPMGDLDRVRRHQSYVRSIMRIAAHDLLVNPQRVDDYLQAVTKTVTVDESLSDAKILALSLELRKLSPENVSFLTAPVSGFGKQGQASVDYLDEAKGSRLWGDLRAGSLDQHLSEFTLLAEVTE